jgi:hypothetical protein
MDAPGTASGNADLDALEALQADAQGLERIEALLDRFNVFETVGFVNQELMHSRLLAYFLDPHQNHGLGDLFLKRLLRETLSSTGDAPLPAFPEDLGGTTVRREHRHIDLLLTNEDHRLAVVVENKVWTGEHSDQLGRYYEQVKGDHPGWQVLGIYLTPYGEAPSHRGYLRLSYGTVCGVLDGVMEDAGSTLTPEVAMTIEHYTDMVRRNIVGDAEVSRLCREIYQKHHRAIHRILEDLTTTSVAIHKLLRRLVNETPNLNYGYRETELLKDWIVFDHRGWDVAALKVGNRYQNSDRLLYFVFYSDFPNSLELWLELGPGDTDTRDRLLDLARRNPLTFAEVPDATEEYVGLFKRTIMTGELLDSLPAEDRQREIRRQWAAFLEDDLPRLEAALGKETWIWESGGAVAEGG